MSINLLAAGRAFMDAVPDGDDFRLRFLDGLEIVVAWGDLGPEVKTVNYSVVTTDIAMHPQFHYVCGKIVRQVLTDGTKLIVQFTDGHELRSSFRSSPQVEGVDVKVSLDGGIQL